MVCAMLLPMCASAILGGLVMDVKYRIVQVNLTAVEEVPVQQTMTLLDV